MDNELSVFEQFKSETDRNDWEYSEKWYSEEYVEWLEAKVANSSNDIQNVIICPKCKSDDVWTDPVITYDCQNCGNTFKS